ncbi:MAG: hypothetical protein IIC67_06865 [Thaumarchaeota archaeon]|nr:hypothetical protein [Nitrososphaerota archaeon]
MTSSDEKNTYHSNFTHFNKIFQQRRLKTIELFVSDIQIIEERIGFQFSLYEGIVKIINANVTKFTKKPISKESKQMLGAINMFTINNKNLFAVYESTLLDFSTAAYSTLRNVFESVMMMYYMVGHKEHIDLLVEYIKLKGDIKNRAPLREDRFKKFRPIEIRQSLYKDEQLESINNIYAALSYSVHPSVYEMNRDNGEYSKKQIQDLMWYNKLLSLYNIHATIENFAIDDEMYHKIMSPEVVGYLNRIVRENSENGGMGDFFPNREEIKNKFKVFPNL